MKQKLLAIIVLLVIASVGGYYLNKSGKLSVRKPQQQVVQPDRIDGEKGVVPKVIPTNLIPTKTAVQENYEVSTNLYKQNTVNLETLDSINQVYEYYLETLKADYTIKRQEITDSNAGIYAYAKNGPQEVNIVIYKNASTSKTQIVISYVNREVK